MGGARGRPHQLNKHPPLTAGPAGPAPAPAALAPNPAAPASGPAAPARGCCCLCVCMVVGKRVSNAGVACHQRRRIVVCMAVEPPSSDNHQNLLGQLQLVQHRLLRRDRLLARRLRRAPLVEPVPVRVMRAWWWWQIRFKKSDRGGG